MNDCGAQELHHKSIKTSGNNCHLQKSVKPLKYHLPYFLFNVTLQLFIDKKISKAYLNYFYNISRSSNFRIKLDVSFASSKCN